MEVGNIDELNSQQRPLVSWLRIMRYLFYGLILMQRNKYEAQGFKFKEGEYKKPCKVGKQKPGLGASDMKIGGAEEREGNVVAYVIKNTGFAELRNIIDKHVKKSRKETVLLTDEATSCKRFAETMDHIVIDHRRCIATKDKTQTQSNHSG